MSRLVMKFGGSSVADVERIRRVARIVAAERRPGRGLAVIVSAMSGDTDKLVAFARDAAGELVNRANGPSRNGQTADGRVDGQTKDQIKDQTCADGDDPPRLNSALAFEDEYDVVVSSGEQITTGLLALALRRLGVPARSWQNWQIPIRTDSAHAKARVDSIDDEKLGRSIDAGEVAVIPGFQGVTADGRISTLGRGGSDTSAVAVAAALRAERCDIYTDVDGVYTTDPRIVAKAQRLERISYEEMLEMASLGAKVLQTRSVELAMAQGVPVRVLSSFVEPGAPNPGTLVCGEEEIVEKQIVSGVAYSRDEAKITLIGVEDHPGVAAEIFGKLADAAINVDMIVQSESRQVGRQNIVFTAPDREAARAQDVLAAARGAIGYDDIHIRRDVAKVSVIGVGMRSHVGVARTMFSALAAKGINIEAIATSEIKISVLIDAQYTELAVRALHTAYGLDGA